MNDYLPCNKTEDETVKIYDLCSKKHKEFRWKEDECFEDLMKNNGDRLPSAYVTLSKNTGLYCCDLCEDYTIDVYVYEITDIDGDEFFLISKNEYDDESSFDDCFLVPKNFHNVLIAIKNIYV